MNDGQIQRGPFTFDEAQKAKADWDREIQGKRKRDEIELGFWAEYEANSQKYSETLQSLYERRDEQERKGQPSTKEIKKRDGLEGFKPSQPPLKTTEKGRFILATPEEIKAWHLTWQREAHDYRRANENRKKSPKAAKASTKQKNKRRDEALRLWHELRAKGVAKHKRIKRISAQMNVAYGTVQRYLKNN